MGVARLRRAANRRAGSAGQSDGERGIAQVDRAAVAEIPQTARMSRVAQGFAASIQNEPSRSWRKSAGVRRGLPNASEFGRTQFTLKVDDSTQGPGSSI